MKKYSVYCHYEGCMIYEVEAEDEEQAAEIAEDRLASEEAETLIDGLVEPEVDVQEIN